MTIGDDGNALDDIFPDDPIMGSRDVADLEHGELATPESRSFVAHLRAHPRNGAPVEGCRWCRARRLSAAVPGHSEKPTETNNV